MAGKTTVAKKATKTSKTTAKTTASKAESAKKVVAGKTTTVKTTPVKKATATKPAASKTTATVKKATTSKATPAKKATATKSVASKVTATVKKATTSKTTPAKKATASKTAVSKTTSTKKTTTAKTTASKVSSAQKIAEKVLKTTATPVKKASKSTSAKASSSKRKTVKSNAKIPTQAEILAWDGDESDYMNERHLAYFRQKLLDWQEDIINNALETAQNLHDQETTSDPADRATQEEEYALSTRIRDRERKLLSKIQASLRQIDEGTYGYCSETGDPIGLKRLDIRPTTTLSVEAQERHEAWKKLQGD